MEEKTVHVDESLMDFPKKRKSPSIEYDQQILLDTISELNVQLFDNTTRYYEKIKCFEPSRDRFSFNVNGEKYKLALVKYPLEMGDLFTQVINPPPCGEKKICIKEPDEINYDVEEDDDARYFANAKSNITSQRRNDIKVYTVSENRCSKPPAGKMDFLGRFPIGSTFSDPPRNSSKFIETSSGPSLFGDIGKYDPSVYKPFWPASIVQKDTVENTVENLNENEENKK